MSLVNAILGAIDNPDQQGSAGQIGGILNTVQQLSQSNAASPDAMQTAVGIVGKYVRSSLQEKRQTEGAEAAAAVVNQYSGTQANPQVVNVLLSSEQAQRLINEVANKTGLSAEMIQGLLPTLIPLVLQFLQSGASQQSLDNSVLNSFLDADGDGDVDMMDAMKMAGKFM
jgi:hypothetical protein